MSGWFGAWGGGGGSAYKDVALFFWVLAEECQSPFAYSGGTEEHTHLILNLLDLLHCKTVRAVPGGADV